MKRVAVYMLNCISGLLRATILSAEVNSLHNDEASRVNFSFSDSERTNAFTALIPETFSCIELLRRSYFVNSRRNNGTA